MPLNRAIALKRFAVMALVSFVAAATLAALPGRAAALIPPDEPGPYHVGYYRTSYYVFPYGFYAAKIRYPAKYDGWRAPKDTSGKPYPGIVVTDGYLSGDCMMDWIAEHLTTRGYVTINFTTPMPWLIDTTQWAAGFKGGISKLKSENGSWFSPLRGLLDTGKFGIAGLSMGGAGAVEAAGTDSRVDAAASLAPGASDIPFSDFVWEDAREAAQNISIPIQIQVGTRDCIVRPSGAHGYYPLVPDATVKEYLEITGANHVNYLDEGSIGEALGELVDCSATIPVEEQHRMSRKYFTAWFHYFLKGRSGFETYIFGAEADSDLDSGALSALEYSLP